MKRLLPLLLLLVVTLVGAAPAYAGPATDAVKKANDNIANLLKTKAPASQLNTAVSNFVDIDQLGQNAMGNLWSQLKPAEQEEFKKTLRKLIEANYVNAQTQNLNYKVNYKGETANPADHTTIVHTEVVTQSKGRPLTIDVDYKLDTNYHCIDIITDDAPLTETYHDMFGKLMANGGYQNLSTKMTNKLQALQAANAGSGGATGSTAPGTSPVAAKP
jgi:ABC-type transporter MlaC component